MSYLNRKKQIILTLDSIDNSIYKNFEVIIVDDGSDENERLEDIIHKYDYEIKLIRINPSIKVWINPVIANNIGIANSTGDIIVLQNPEVCHIGDVIYYIANNLKANEYLTFSCYALPSFKHNDLLSTLDVQNVSLIKKFISYINYEDYKFDYKYYVNKYTDLINIKNEKEAIDHWNKIGIKEHRHCNISNIFQPQQYIDWKGWYNHPIFNKRDLNFLSCTFKSNILKIGGFDENYANGLWYDDNDFLERIKLKNIILSVDDSNVFGIHQYHNNGSAYHTDFNENKQLYNNLLLNIQKNHDCANWKTKNYKKLYNDKDLDIFSNIPIKNKKICIGITTYSSSKTLD